MVEREQHADFKAYQRPFAQPLRAAWGTWDIRKGWLTAGPFGFGEVAPLPTGINLKHSPQDYSAEWDFAQWSANQPPAQPAGPVRSAALLSLQANTVQAMDALREEGYCTFKIKVGIAPPEEEYPILRKLLQQLSNGENLRLDPNRSWSLADWTFWEPRLSPFAGQLQFIEEPFLKEMPSETLLAFGHSSAIPLALDESLNGDGLAYWAGKDWPGYWVLKPSLMGDPTNWLPLLRKVADKVILSSAFETGIGLNAILRLAKEFPSETLHGLGTQSWFNDTWGLTQKGPLLFPLTEEQQAILWNSI